MASHTIKLKLPKDASSVSHGSTTYPVGADGCVEVPADLAPLLRETFGATDPPPPKK